METSLLTIDMPNYPERLLTRVKHSPKQLYVMGTPLEELLKYPTVAIVGSRTVSAEGKQTTYNFAQALARQGIVIISGLALGVDSLAHQTTLETGGKTIAVLPSHVNNVTPAANKALAKEILNSGGALVSEYGPGDRVFASNFVARNRIVAGLADVLLITEAGAESGALYTASFALKQKRTIVMAVPGSIYSHHSAGTNHALTKGALPATDVSDVLRALKFRPRRSHIKQLKGNTPQEQLLLDLIAKGVRRGEELLEQSKLEVTDFNLALTMLEINDLVRSLGGNQWAIT